MRRGDIAKIHFSIFFSGCKQPKPSTSHLIPRKEKEIFNYSETIPIIYRFF